MLQRCRNLVFWYRTENQEISKTKLPGVWSRGQRIGQRLRTLTLHSFLPRFIWYQGTDFKSWFSHFLAVWPWASYLTSLSPGWPTHPSLSGTVLVLQCQVPCLGRLPQSQENWHGWSPMSWLWDKDNNNLPSILSWRLTEIIYVKHSALCLAQSRNSISCLMW